jgi:hypothetical protein
MEVMGRRKGRRKVLMGRRAGSIPSSRSVKLVVWRSISPWRGGSEAIRHPLGDGLARRWKELLLSGRHALSASWR